MSYYQIGRAPLTVQDLPFAADRDMGQLSEWFEFWLREVAKHDGAELTLEAELINLTVHTDGDVTGVPPVWVDVTQHESARGFLTGMVR